MKIFENTVGPDTIPAAAAHESLAALEVRQNRSGEAKGDTERALAIREKVLGAWDRTVAFDLDDLALLDVQAGRLSQAEPLALQASAILEKTTGPDYPDRAVNLYALGRIRSAQGRYEEA